MNYLKFLSIVALTAASTAMTMAGNVETRAYFSTNPEGQVGKQASISIDGRFSDWSEDLIIARNGANNISTAYKGSHENNVLDIYAVLGAWDDENLYIGWQMCNTGDVWAREGDGPLTDYGKIGNVPMILALSVDPSKTGMTGLLEDGRGIWMDQAGNGVTFDPAQLHVDHLFFFSAMPGQGVPAMFKAVNANGATNYGSGCTQFSQCGITYNRGDGFMLSSLWRCRSTAEWYTPTQLKSDPSVLNDIYDIEKYDDLLAGPVSGLKPHDTNYDTFFEIKIPLKTLGITRQWLENNGVGVRVIATRGESALDCCPFDPEMVNNTFEEYGKDNSTTHEKDDLDVITYAMADIAKARDLQNIEPLPDPDPNPNPDPTPNPDPVDGEYIVYFDQSGCSWSQIYTYVWDAGAGNKELLGAWPGKQMSQVTVNGKTLLCQSFSSETSLAKGMIIFNKGWDGNGNQTGDWEFVNHGVYNISGYTGETIHVLSEVNTVGITSSDVIWFDLQGHRVESPVNGLYIRVSSDGATKVLL